MAHLIEAAKSGRSTCRTCRELIEKGAPRFGLETEGFDGNPGHVWHHLACAAKKLSAQVKETLPSFTGELANRAEIEAILTAPPAKVAGEKNYPFAERASTGRAKCLACENAIEKGSFRVAIEREIEVMGAMRKGPGYYHPGCTADLGEGLLEKLKANSELNPEELQELSGQLT